MASGVVGIQTTVCESGRVCYVASVKKTVGTERERVEEEEGEEEEGEKTYEVRTRPPKT